MEIKINHVKIINKKANEEIGSFPINLGGLNYQPTEVEIKDLAWKCEKEDGLVDGNPTPDFAFEIS